MDINRSLSLLAGMTPAQFMRRHWQKKPLLVRQAFADFKPLLSRAQLLALAGRDDVESRLIVKGQSSWQMKQGPFGPRSLPPQRQPGWTLLVQGVDLHDDKAHALLQQFRFVPDARLDDLMVSLASEGGGVGPHFDSYDVFLLQASGRRLWKIGKQKDLTLQPGVPLKILQNFQPEEEFMLEAGDMLYLPPRYAHDGIAQAPLQAGAKDAGRRGDCMTYSIGFRAPARRELASELLYRLADFAVSAQGDEETAQQGTASSPLLYRDPAQSATATPAALPLALEAFARQALQQAMKDPLAVGCALGEYMTELKPSVWFDAPAGAGNINKLGGGVCLDAKSKMMYDGKHVFINGESYRAQGADARLMRRLADQRLLSDKDIAKASAAALALLAEWYGAGWIRAVQAPAVL